MPLPSHTHTPQTPPFRLNAAELLGSASAGRARWETLLSVGTISAVALANPPLDQVMMPLPPLHVHSHLPSPTLLTLLTLLTLTL